jgi:hypothetical protein
MPPRDRDTRTTPAASAAAAAAGGKKKHHDFGGKGGIIFVNRFSAADLNGETYPVFGCNVTSYTRKSGPRSGFGGQAHIFKGYPNPMADKQLAVPVVTCDGSGTPFFANPEKPTAAEIKTAQKWFRDTFNARARQLLAEGKTLLIPTSPEGNVNLGTGIGQFNMVSGMREFVNDTVATLVAEIGIGRVEGFGPLVVGEDPSKVREHQRRVQNPRARGGEEHSRTRGGPDAPRTASSGAAGDDSTDEEELQAAPDDLLAPMVTAGNAASDMTPDEAAEKARRLTQDGVLEGNPDEVAESARQAAEQEGQMTPKEIEAYNAAFDEAVAHKKFQGAATNEMLAKLGGGAVMVGPKFALGFMEELNNLTKKNPNDKGDLYLGVLIFKAICWLAGTPFKVAEEFASKAQEKWRDTEELDLKHEIDAKNARKAGKKVPEVKTAASKHTAGIPDDKDRGDIGQLLKDAKIATPDDDGPGLG